MKRGQLLSISTLQLAYDANDFRRRSLRKPKERGRSMVLNDKLTLSSALQISLKPESKAGLSRLKSCLSLGRY